MNIVDLMNTQYEDSCSDSNFDRNTFDSESRKSKVNSTMFETQNMRKQDSLAIQSGIQLSNLHSSAVPILNICGPVRRVDAVAVKGLDSLSLVPAQCGYLRSGTNPPRHRHSSLPSRDRSSCKSRCTRNQKGSIE